MTLHSQQYINDTRLGWSQEEDELLFEAVRDARQAGKPLKAVFDKVAKSTGRKPNSIRNYYYLRVKQSDDLQYKMPHNPAFIPFKDEEIIELLKTVFTAQAKGISVRACTLQMGGGDNRVMLRYQNKYRSLLKCNPDLVKNVIEEMKKAGEATIDPYDKAPKMRKAGRPRKQRGSLLEIVGDAINQLDKIEDLDVEAFFTSLNALASLASRGAAQLQLRGMDENLDASTLLEEKQELKAQLQSQKKELNAQRERFNTLLGYFRQLMDVNREFLGLTSVTKVSSLSNYIRELSRNVEDCERWMLESK